MSIETLAPSAPAPPAPPITAFNGGGGPSFSDLLDIVNPLQHIPIINTLYQHLTGDSEGAVADVVGGTLWTGPIGLIGSLIDLDVRAESGKSIGDTVLGWLGLDSDPPDSALAQQGPAPQPAAQATQAAQLAQTAQPAALVGPPPAPARAERDSRNPDDTATGEDGDGPRHVGAFLVFGAAGSTVPAALPPPAPAPAATATVGRQGNYLVFGGSPGADGPATATASGGISGRSYAAPARRSQQTPSALPPPTTGPAALPGHGPSQAIPLPNPGDDWFTQAVSAGLNKYQAAHRNDSDTSGE